MLSASSQGTADDAGQSKRSAVALGYYTDECCARPPPALPLTPLPLSFISYFNPKPSRRSPLINRSPPPSPACPLPSRSCRGYYARVVAIRRILQQVEQCAEHYSIVTLCSM
jgi:hypothetical protein